MGLLSKLFNAAQDDSDEEELEAEEAESHDTWYDSDRNPNLREGMTLDVMSRKVEQHLTGKLTTYRFDLLTLERLPGWLSFKVLPYGEEVIVKGYNRAREPFQLPVTVLDSTRVVCRLRDYQRELTDDNHRLNFRIPMNTPAWLYRQNDEKYLYPEPCTLMDISTGGCRVESVCTHKQDEVLRVKIKLEDYRSLQFLGEVIRVNDLGEGRYQYGILFAQLREDELMALTGTLYNIQVASNKDGA